MPVYLSTLCGQNYIFLGVVSPSGGLEKPISVVNGEIRECVTVVMQSDTDWQSLHDLLDEAQRVLKFIDNTPLQVYPHLFLIFPHSHTTSPLVSCPEPT